MFAFTHAIGSNLINITVLLAAFGTVSVVARTRVLSSSVRMRQDSRARQLEAAICWRANQE